MVQERAIGCESAAANEISRSAATEKKGKKKVPGGAEPQPPRGDLQRDGAPAKKVNRQNLTPAAPLATIGAGSSAAGTASGKKKIAGEAHTADGLRRRVSREERKSQEDKRRRIVRREEEHRQKVAVKKVAGEKLAEVKEEVVSENEEGQQLAAVEIQKKKAKRDMGKEMKQVSSSMDKVRKKKSAMKKPAARVETPETEEVEPEEEAAVEGDEDHVAAGEQEEQQDKDGGNEKEKEVVAPEEQDVLGTRKFEGIRVLTKPDTTEEKVVARRTRASFKSPLPSRHQSDYCKNHGAINRPIDIDQLSDSEGVASN